MGLKGDNTKQRIVEGALQLFSQKGYLGTSVQDVVDEVGLTKGGIYAHYKSKEELWNSAYEEAVRIWKSIVFDGVHEIEDPLEKIKTVIENDLLNYVGKDVFAGGCFFLSCLMEVSGQIDSMTKRILKGYDGFARQHELWLKEANELGILRDGVNTGEVADYLIAMLNGATAMYASTRDARYLTTCVAQTREYIESLSA